MVRCNFGLGRARAPRLLRACQIVLRGIEGKGDVCAPDPDYPDAVGHQTQAVFRFPRRAEGKADIGQAIALTGRTNSP